MLSDIGIVYCVPDWCGGSCRPLLTKSFTSFSGFVVGDAIAQLYAGEKYDYWRTARFAAYGFIIHAPACHAWYGILDSRVYPKAPTRYTNLSTDMTSVEVAPEHTRVVHTVAHYTMTMHCDARCSCWKALCKAWYGPDSVSWLYYD